MTTNKDAGKDPKTTNKYAGKDSGDYHAINMQERIQEPEKRWRKEIQSPQIKEQERNPDITNKGVAKDPETTEMQERNLGTT